MKKSLMQDLVTAVLADSQLAILTVLLQTVFSQWVIQSDMKQVFSSKSLLTAGRLNFLIFGFRAVMFGLFRVMKEVLKLSLKVGLMKAGTVISTMLITEIATL